MDVDAERCQEETGQTADGEEADEAEAYSIGVSKEIEPLYMVRSS